MEHSATARVATLQRHLCASSTSSTDDLSDPAVVQRLLADYDEKGYVVVRNLFTADELASYRERFEDICAGRAPRQPAMIVMKDIALAKAGGEIRCGDDCTKIQDYHEDPVLFGFCKHPKVLQYVRLFCGDSVRSIHSMLINKPSDLGTGSSRHPLHQDLYYFPLRPANRIVATWVAMEHVHRANGCLSVIPGSHKGHLMEHGYPQWEGGVNKLYHGVLGDVDLDKREFLEMQAGDCVLFHPLLIHGSGRNTTDGFRKAISCHYASGTDCEFASVPDSLLEENFQDVAEADQETKDEMMRIFWTHKSRQVCGTPHPRWTQDA